MTEREIAAALEVELARLDQLRGCAYQSRVTRALIAMTSAWIEHLQIALMVARKVSRS